MKKRTVARELAFHLLYQYDILGHSPSDVKQTFWHGLSTVVPRIDEEEDEEVKDAYLKAPIEVQDEVRVFAEQLFDKAVTNQESSDNLIREHLKKGWSFERLGVIERTILRLAISELLDGDAPVFAIFDDYVTLTRRYTDDEKAAGLINGMLDKIKTTYNVTR